VNTSATQRYKACPCRHSLQQCLKKIRWRLNLGAWLARVFLITWPPNKLPISFMLAFDMRHLEPSCWKYLVVPFSHLVYRCTENGRVSSESVYNDLEDGATYWFFTSCTIWQNRTASGLMLTHTRAFPSFLIVSPIRRGSLNCTVVWNALCDFLNVPVCPHVRTRNKRLSIEYTFLLVCK
jgi:hypothetical protein